MEKICRITITEKCFNLAKMPLWWNNHLGEEFRAYKSYLDKDVFRYRIVKEDLSRIEGGSLSAIIYSPYCTELSEIKENEIIYWN